MKLFESQCESCGLSVQVCRRRKSDPAEVVVNLDFAALQQLVELFRSAASRPFLGLETAMAFDSCADKLDALLKPAVPVDAWMLSRWLNSYADLKERDLWMDGDKVPEPHGPPNARTTLVGVGVETLELRAGRVAGCPDLPPGPDRETSETGDS